MSNEVDLYLTFPTRNSWKALNNGTAMQARQREQRD